jgi:hypothetical protein
MTGNAINSKSEALDVRELSSKELDAVSGGNTISEQAKIDAELKREAETIKLFQQALKELP